MLNAVEFEHYFDSILALKSRKTCSLPIQLTRRCCKWLVDRSLLRENYAAQARIKREISDEYDRRKEAACRQSAARYLPAGAVFLSRAVFPCAGHAVSLFGTGFPRDTRGA